MAHRIRVRANLAAWNANPVVLASEMDALDEGQFESITGDQGGTWAPAAVITIGGSGLTVTGPCDITQSTGFDLTSGFLSIHSGATLRINSGGTSLVSAGAAQQVAGSLEIVPGGVFQLDSSINPTYASARTIGRRGCRLACTSDAGASLILGSGPSSPDAWTTKSLTSAGKHYNVIATKSLTALGTEAFSIELPDPIDGATLTSVSIQSTGLSNTPTTYPTYQVVRENSGVTTSLQSGGPQLDHHSTPTTWTSLDTTLILPDQNNVIDRNAYKYLINCTPPAEASGTWMYITDVIAGYLVPDLRP